MADKTLTVTTVGGADKTLTFNRDRFAGVRNMTRVEAGGATTTITVNRTASGVRTGDKSGQSRPLLNKVVGGAAAAYSLRDLNDKTNTTKVVRVRRGSDDAELDFTAKDINTSVVENWVGAGNDGFVSIWYDQSGNGKNASQPAINTQPTIVSNGVLIINTSGETSVSFSKTRRDALTANASVSLPCHSFVYAEDLSEGATHRPLLGGNPAGIGIMQGGAIRLYHGTSVQTSLPAVTGAQIISARSVGADSNIFQNGTFKKSGDAGTLALPLTLGDVYFWDLAVATNLLISEAIIYPSDESLNRPAIEANIRNQYGINFAGLYVNATGSRYINGAGELYLQP